ncbi:hypothetical protein N9937_01375 [bacterium]|nr:hypothetical protein [bacterium]
MSNIFGPFCRLQGVLPLNIGSGALVDPVEYMGTRCDNRGRIYSMINTQIDHWANGLPFNIHGRLCVATSAVAYWDQGVPFTATRHVCIGNLPKTNWDQGLAFNAAGKIVHTTDANPFPPWMPLVYFFKDFTTDLTLEPFNLDHRDSWAMGADDQGIQRTVDDDVPVFIGARVVSNIVPYLVDVAEASYAIVGGAQLAVGHMSFAFKGNGSYLRITPKRSMPDGSTVTVSVELSSVDFAGQLFIFQQVDASNALVGSNISVTPTAGTLRYSFSMPKEPTGVAFRLFPSVTGAVDGGEVFINHACIELNVAAPSAFFDGTQHLTTANANTVDPVTHVVTEAIGPSILPVEGLQLEGSRTNEHTSTNLLTWSVTNGARTLHPSIPAPDRSLTSLHLNDQGSFSGPVSSGQSSVWARALPGQGGGTAILHDNYTAGVLETLTEEWQRFDANRGEGTRYSADVRAASPGTLTECLVWVPQNEASATFPSSGIETPGDSTTRAATVCNAPFADIPALPDEGVYNDFCGQVVVEFPQTMALSPNLRLLQVRGGGVTDFIYITARDDGTIRMQGRRGGTYGAWVAAPSAGATTTLMDVRFKCSSTEGFKLWLNGGGPGVQSGETGDWPAPLNEVLLNDDVASPGATGFGIYKNVRIVPAAQTDQEIEGWAGAWEGEPVITGSAVVGSTLTATQGTLTGTTTLSSIAYTWHDGSTGTTYVVQEGDTDIYVDARVTDTSGNAYGPYRSDTVAVVAEFTHDFTTATLGGFSFTRGYPGTGPQGNGVHIEVPADVPVFPGGYYYDGGWHTSPKSNAHVLEAIRVETVRPVNDPIGHALPIVGFWGMGTGFEAGSPADPDTHVPDMNWWLDRIEIDGYYFQPSMKIYSPSQKTKGFPTAGYMASITAALPRLREMNIPFTMAFTQIEAYLTQVGTGEDRKTPYSIKPAATNPNKLEQPDGTVVDPQTLDAWPPEPTDWDTCTDDWWADGNSVEFDLVKSEIPNPFFVTFLNNNEHQKVGSRDFADNWRYTELYPALDKTEEENRDIYAQQWRALYPRVIAGAKANLPQAYADNSRWCAYETGQRPMKMGRTAGWQAPTLVTDGSMDYLYGETYDMYSTPLYTNYKLGVDPSVRESLDDHASSIHTGAGAYPDLFIPEAKSYRPDYIHSLSLWNGGLETEWRLMDDAGKVWDGERWQASALAVTWMLRVRDVRLFWWAGQTFNSPVGDLDDRSEFESNLKKYYWPYCDRITEIHENPLLTKFWRKATMIPNPTDPKGLVNHAYRYAVPTEYQDGDRNYRMDCSVNPAQPYTGGVIILAHAFAFLYDEGGTKEWLLHIAGPDLDTGQTRTTTVDIPDWGTTPTITVRRGGSYYHMVEGSSVATEIEYGS